MTDLNDWQLDYSGVSFPFGTLATGYPFTRQVDIGAPASSFNDAAHPSTDGTVFGAEKLQGRTLTFEVAVPKVYGGGDRWHENLDAVETITAAWEATPVRTVPGAVAELRNLNRGRLVYGRPRNLKPKLDKARQGWSELVCNFATVDHKFYGLTEYSTLIEIPAGQSTGFATPITFPWTSEIPTDGNSYVGNAGTKDTWPVITITGPCLSPKVELLADDGVTVVWWLKLEEALTAGEVAVIDTRPWRRTVTIGGEPAGGLLRGTRINEATLPPGLSQIRYSATDATGTSDMTMTWRDAYASL